MEVGARDDQLHPPYLSFFFAASSLKYFLYLIAITVTAFVSQSIFYHSQNGWILLTVLVFALLTDCRTAKSHVLCLGLTGIVAVISVFVASLAAHYFYLLATYLFLFTVTVMYLSQVFPQHSRSLLVISLLTMLSAGLICSPSQAIDRVLFVSLGIVITCIFQIILYFHYVRDEWQWFMVRIIRQLITLNNEIFSCFLQLDYSDCLYLYEKRLHVQKIKCKAILAQLRQLVSQTPEEKRSHFDLTQQKLGQIYDLLLDAAQLRRRVSDYATFSLCRRELQDINQEINRLLDGLVSVINKNHFTPDVAMLQQKIDRLEDIYQHVLQVSAPEPLVFLLFIGSLQLLSKEIMTCYDLI